jgi:surfeit locus 1 family protein
VKRDIGTESAEADFVFFQRRIDSLLDGGRDESRPYIGSMKLTFRDALGAAFILAMCAMCVRLGFWQLDRLEQRRARNAVVLAGMRQAPRPIDEALVAEMRRDPERLAYRRVVARGRYLPAAELVLRGRVEGGRPGVHLATPLLLEDDGSVLLVNRGWVPAADAVTPAERPAPPAGTVVVEGILQEVPITQDRGGRSISARADTAYRRLDRGEAQARLGPRVLPMYLQLLGDTGGARSLPVAVPPPPLDEGPHLGYAIQWFSFALIGVVGLVVLLRRRGGAARA